jgi:hypothetical protein
MQGMLLGCFGADLGAVFELSLALLGVSLGLFLVSVSVLTAESVLGVGRTYVQWTDTPLFGARVLPIIILHE